MIRKYNVVASAVVLAAMAVNCGPQRRTPNAPPSLTPSEVAKRAAKNSPLGLQRVESQIKTDGSQRALAVDLTTNRPNVLGQPGQATMIMGKNGEVSVVTPNGLQPFLQNASYKCEDEAGQGKQAIDCQRLKVEFNTTDANGAVGKGNLSLIQLNNLLTQITLGNQTNFFGTASYYEQTFTEGTKSRKFVSVNVTGAQSGVSLSRSRSDNSVTFSVSGLPESVEGKKIIYSDDPNTASITSTGEHISLVLLYKIEGDETQLTMGIVVNRGTSSQGFELPPPSRTEVTPESEIPPTEERQPPAETGGSEGAPAFVPVTPAEEVNHTPVTPVTSTPVNTPPTPTTPNGRPTNVGPSVATPTPQVTASVGSPQVPRGTPLPPSVTPSVVETPTAIATPLPPPTTAVPADPAPESTGFID